VAGMIGPLAPGEAFTFEIVNFPAGIASLVGAKIVSRTTLIEVAPRKTGAVEGDPGIYFIGLTCPTLPGVYSVQGDWAGGATPRPSQIAEEDLVVEAIASTGATTGTLDLLSGARVAIPHVSMPPRFVNGRLVVVEQDSIEEIRDCVANIARYRIGDRPEKPGFGIDDQTFSQNGPDVGLMAAQISVWEPRAGLAAQLDGTHLEELVANVVINVTDQGGTS
jgi:hypothetical protein